MSKTPLSGAEALYRENVAATRESADWYLDDNAPLPDPELSDGLLHPNEAAVFGIDPAHWPELWNALDWYYGAIVEIAQNGYALFRDEEQARWSMGPGPGSEPVFNERNAVQFLHLVTGCRLRECQGVIARDTALYNRSNLVTFPDEQELSG